MLWNPSTNRHYYILCAYAAIAFETKALFVLQITILQYYIGTWSVRVCVCECSSIMIMTKTTLINRNNTINGVLPDVYAAALCDVTKS